MSGSDNQPLLPPGLVWKQPEEGESATHGDHGLIVNVFSSVASTVFPKWRNLPSQPYRVRFMSGSEELSSLPLQVMLYFNNLMFPVVLFAGGWSVRTKMTDWEELELNFFFVLITTIMFVVWALLEAIRLFAGWPGNLKEKVPQLTGFVMLTGFQVPISCYHLFLQAGVTAFDRGLWTAVLLFTVPEMVFGFRTVKRLIRSQAEGFYLAHVDDADGGFGAGAGESSPTGEHPSLLQGGRRRM